MELDSHEVFVLKEHLKYFHEYELASINEVSLTQMVDSSGVYLRMVGPEEAWLVNTLKEILGVE